MANDYAKIIKTTIRKKLIMKVYGSGGGLVSLNGLDDGAIPLMWKLACIHIELDIAPIFRGFVIAKNLNDVYYVYSMNSDNGVDWCIDQFVVYDEYGEGMLNCLMHVQANVEELQATIDSGGNEAIWLADYNPDSGVDIGYVDVREVEEADIPEEDYIRFYIGITQAIITHGKKEDTALSFDWTKTLPF